VSDGPEPDLPLAVGELPAAAKESLGELVSMLASERGAPSAVRDPDEAWRVHVADSLAGLEFPELRCAERVADVGSGAGLPGLVLAAALPGAGVDLIESVGRKCAFIERAASRAAIANVRVVCGRSETWALGEGREAYDAVTARAVGRLSSLAELASPLLRDGAALVAWKGRRDPDEEDELRRAAGRLAMEPVEIRWVGPYAGSRNRHLHLLRKSGPTPDELPRRPGIAKKRPFGK
jgi:16S rRNA (guanine527-N7)-methyltransferase